VEAFQREMKRLRAARDERSEVTHARLAKLNIAVPHSKHNLSVGVIPPSSSR